MTSLHPRERQNQPNFAVLNKLRSEMKKMQDRRVSALYFRNLFDNETYITQDCIKYQLQCQETLVKALRYH